MNHAVKSAFAGPRAASHCFVAVASFHATPVLERKRRNQWNNRFNRYAPRSKRLELKRNLLRNISDYAEYLFQSWREEDERYTSANSTVWFRRQYWSKGSRVNGFSSQESIFGRDTNKRKVGFGFCTSDDDDDDEAESIFYSAFEGVRYRSSSFNNSRRFQWGDFYSQANNRSSSNWRHETDDECDTPPQPQFALERQALGLSASGPLKLDEVKSAYRSCALRWHPDRHQGSSKVAAEEKFKHCSAAYKLLCEKLDLAKM